MEIMFLFWLNHYSRFFEISITKNTAAEKITQAMWKMFVTQDIPLLVQTDNGLQFQKSK